MSHSEVIVAIGDGHFNVEARSRSVNGYPIPLIFTQRENFQSRHIQRASEFLHGRSSVSSVQERTTRQTPSVAKKLRFPAPRLLFKRINIRFVVVGLISIWCSETRPDPCVHKSVQSLRTAGGCNSFLTGKPQTLQNVLRRRRTDVTFGANWEASFATLKIHAPQVTSRKS
ncbi:hypothetical protein TNCV_447891 [Trichonephila clavipes]|nr:hypothetical protein TNCV_447891 [Trichonephila clavipes]